MKSNYLLVFLGLIALIVLAVWVFYPFGREQALSPEQHGADQSSMHESPTQSSRPAIVGAESDGSLNNDTKDSAISNVPNFPGITDQADEVPTEVDSPELSEWKKQHDFALDDSQLNFYTSLSDVQLQELAENGDVVGMREFGTRLTRSRGSLEQGVDWLIEAASYGSHQALIELALINLQGIGLNEPDELAYLAWLRVSYMLGNWEALMVTAHHVQKKLSVEEMYMVDVMAANFMGEVNSRHSERTGLDINLNLKPGYKEALDLMTLQ